MVVIDWEKYSEYSRKEIREGELRKIARKAINSYSKRYGFSWLYINENIMINARKAN